MSTKDAAGTVEIDALRLDLGCGQHCRAGFVGVDQAPIADVAWDLRVTPWPWPTASVSEVYCSHFLEHLTGIERIPFFNELHRVLPTGAQATIIVPYYSSMRAVQDPTHQWPPLCEASFLYVNRAWRVENGLDHYPLTCDFDFTFGHQVIQEWVIRSEEARAFAMLHYGNVVTDLQVTLTRRPDGM